MKGLNNPAMILAAQKASEKSEEVKEKLSGIMPFVLKVSVVFLAGYLAYRLFFNRFEAFSINSSYPSSNITQNQAQARADAIYNAMLGIGTGFDIVKQQIKGLNYNAFVLVYNAFGARKGANPLGKEMNMIEWFYDQYNENELNDLRFLVNGIF